MEKTTITDEPNQASLKINPIDIDPSDPIGRRGKPTKVKVKKAEKVIPGVQGETSPEEERDFQKGVREEKGMNIRKNLPKTGGEEGGGGRNAGVGRKDDTRKNAEPVTEMPAAGAASVLSTSPDTDSYPPMGISKQKVVESKGDLSFTGTDKIPESRLNTDNKSQEELRADIRYFFSNFPKPLRNLKSQARNLNQMGLVQLQRLHKRIVNVLQPNKIQMRGKKVGVVIDAEEYIKQKVGEVMISNAIKGYEIPNLQPLTTENENENEEEDVKDIGSYEVKRGPDGGLNAQKEPVYRFIPTTNEDELEEISYDYESKRKPKRMNLPKTKMRNQVVTGKRQVAANPFLKKQGGHRLNVLL